MGLLCERLCLSRAELPISFPSPSSLQPCNHYAVNNFFWKKGLTFGSIRKTMFTGKFYQQLTCPMQQQALLLHTAQAL